MTYSCYNISKIPVMTGHANLHELDMNLPAGHKEKVVIVVIGWMSPEHLRMT